MHNLQHWRIRSSQWQNKSWTCAPSTCTTALKHYNLCRYWNPPHCGNFVMIMRTLEIWYNDKVQVMQSIEECQHTMELKLQNVLHHKSLWFFELFLSNLSSCVHFLGASTSSNVIGKQPSSAFFKARPTLPPENFQFTSWRSTWLWKQLSILWNALYLNSLTVKFYMLNIFIHLGKEDTLWTQSWVKYGPDH